MTRCGCCEPGAILVWVNTPESITLASAQSLNQPGFTWSSRIRSPCGSWRETGGFMYTITHTRWSSAECYTFCFWRQGIRLIIQMHPAANNVHNQGFLTFTPEEMAPLTSRWDASLQESCVCVFYVCGTPLVNKTPTKQKAKHLERMAEIQWNCTCEHSQLTVLQISDKMEDTFDPVVERALSLSWIQAANWYRVLQLCSLSCGKLAYQYICWGSGRLALGWRWCLSWSHTYLNEERMKN